MNMSRVTLKKENQGVCQICLNKGHWTYECEKKRAYLYRPSAMTLYNNRKLGIPSSIDQSQRKKIKPPKYRIGRRDRKRFGEQPSESESSSGSDSDSESGQEEQESDNNNNNRSESNDSQRSAEPENQFHAFQTSKAYCLVGV